MRNWGYIKRNVILMKDWWKESLKTFVSHVEKALTGRQTLTAMWKCIWSRVLNNSTTHSVIKDSTEKKVWHSTDGCTQKKWDRKWIWHIQKCEGGGSENKEAFYMYVTKFVTDKCAKTFTSDANPVWQLSYTSANLQKYRRGTSAFFAKIGALYRWKYKR